MDNIIYITTEHFFFRSCGQDISLFPSQFLRILPLGNVILTMLLYDPLISFLAEVELSDVKAISDELSYFISTQ